MEMLDRWRWGACEFTQDLFTTSRGTIALDSAWRFRLSFVDKLSQSVPMKSANTISEFFDFSKDVDPREFKIYWRGRKSRDSQISSPSESECAISIIDRSKDDTDDNVHESVDRIETEVENDNKTDDTDSISERQYQIDPISIVIYHINFRSRYWKSNIWAITIEDTCGSIQFRRTHFHSHMQLLHGRDVNVQFLLHLP